MQHFYSRLKFYAILILTSIFNSAIVHNVVAHIRQGVIHLREIRYKNATIFITGEPNLEKIKEDTVKFLKRVRVKKTHAYNATRTISKK